MNQELRRLLDEEQRRLQSAIAASEREILVLRERLAVLEKARDLLNHASADSRSVDSEHQRRPPRGYIIPKFVSQAGSPNIVSDDIDTVDRAAPPSGLTIKEQVLMVLDRSPKPLPAGDILLRINDLFNNRLVRTSLSPQLSRLRDEGRIHYDECTRCWGLPKHFVEIDAERDSRID